MLFELIFTKSEHFLQHFPADSRRCLYENIAVPLTDDNQPFGTEPRFGEKIYKVFQAHLCFVYEKFIVAVSADLAGNDNLGKFRRKKVAVVFKIKRCLRLSNARTLGRSREYEVFGFGSAEIFGFSFAQKPADCVYYV